MMTVVLYCIECRHRIERSPLTFEEKQSEQFTHDAWFYCETCADYIDGLEDGMIVEFIEYADITKYFGG